MAYISTEKVKEVRKELKTIFNKKEGFKLSVTRYHYSQVCVNIMESPIDFTGVYINEYNYETSEDLTDTQKAIIGVILKNIDRVCGASYNRNAGDLSADYPDYNYTVSLTVGKWDKPFQFIKQ